LVADMTSCLMTEPVEVSNYGVIFAGAQKNLANAGLTVLIISQEMLNRAQSTGIPTALDYVVTAQHHSLYVTPPVFNCYVMLTVLKWVKAQGGVKHLYQVNQQKAKLLYDYIDGSDWYTNPVSPEARSLVNIPFSLPDKTLETKFIQQAQAKGLIGLEGHRLVGGLRASLYNAMPLEGVLSLIEFMEAFKKT
jgi:phosphoserine aminotransferase